MSGRTLIKVTIATALFVVVAFIVVPNFIDDGRSGGSRVSRVKNDMRSMATGIETYFADNHSYPVAVPLRESVKDLRAFDKSGGTHLGTLPGGNATVAGLTSPIAYVTSLFHDPYGYGSSFAYHTDGPGWILISPGPDRKYDIQRPEEVYTSAEDQPSTRVLLLAYDPTNGTISAGDAWRVK